MLLLALSLVEWGYDVRFENLGSGRTRASAPVVREDESLPDPWFR